MPPRPTSRPLACQQRDWQPRFLVDRDEAERAFAWPTSPCALRPSCPLTLSSRVVGGCGTRLPGWPAVVPGCVAVPALTVTRGAFSQNVALDSYHPVMPVSKGRKKKGKNKRRVDRPATGVLLDPELAAEMLLNAPAELLPLYTLLYAWQTMSAGRPANTCTTACLSLQSALARLGIASEPRVVQATITCRDRGARVGSRHPRWNGTYWDGHMVLVLRDQGRFVDMTLHQARVLPRTGMYAAPIVGRCANPATGVPATLQPGDIAMLQRGEYLIQYEALEDQGSWHGTVGEADWAGLEQNADNVISLTLDTLRGEGLIERAREAPYPKLQAALAAAKGS